ncbi:2,4-dienoyl-CoA reductase [NADPH] (EC [Olavius sp. associated proteobacterium Delta 1]|nr:2,4-dienoyl-CoA reductase [NADPH] (EC [Olavius sp. associated proteobacterium Delta 1]
MYDNLFTKLKVGGVELSNRICFLAHRTNFARRGRLNERHIAYYRRRAQGGCGLVVVGELAIHAGDRPWEAMIEAFQPQVVDDYLRLTDAVHEFDSRIFAQLNHHGFQSSGSISRQAIWGPSAMADIEFGETAKAMEAEDMATLAAAFAAAAELARAGGFDGVEIDMGPQSLLRQFLSPLSNHRQDEYGGSPENRMRLPLEVVEATRKAVGSDFTVGIRLCVDEKFWGSITIDESRRSAQRFESTGQIDFINTSVGTYYNLYLTLASMHTPIGFTVDLAEQIKKSVSLPTMASYQIGFPQMAEEIITAQRADMVGFVRALICDPDMAKKARAGKPENIRYCVKDNKGCIGRINQNKMLGCIQNSLVGEESPAGEKTFRPAANRKQVMVVGGGPAGLEAARSARLRGHTVTVYEKDRRIGGQINLIKKRPGRQAMAGVVRYLRHALAELEVPIVTDTRVNADFVAQQHPDAVVVATGSRPRPKPVPGNYGPPLVLDVRQVLNESFAVGEKVLFIDENGGHHATATVEFLANQGKNVHMVTSDLFIGIELGPLGDLYLTRQRLLQLGVKFTSDVIIDKIEENVVKAREIFTNTPIRFEDFDTIILDMGNVAEDQLYRQLKGQIRELYRIGDCVAPRGIDMAILEGRQAGEQL